VAYYFKFNEVVAMKWISRFKTMSRGCRCGADYDFLLAILVVAEDWTFFSK